MSIRVVLVDDHPALRIGLRIMLEQAADIQVVADAGDGDEALLKIKAHSDGADVEFLF